MATLVSLHAHPDDACIGCGGALRKAADEGHRVVLVVATGGEQNALPDGFLEPGESLAERRLAEARVCADILGIETVHALGYLDSGEPGAPSNDAPGSFATCSVEEAAQRVAEILRAEGADVLTTYDDNGGYGHPDHIQCHKVGYRAAELAGVERVYQATANRDEIRRSQEAQAEGSELPDIDFGKPEADLTTRVDVTTQLAAKRAAMRAHHSQIAEKAIIATLVDLPDHIFAAAFDAEWYIRIGQGPGITEDDLMAGLPATDGLRRAG